MLDLQLSMARLRYYSRRIGHDGTVVLSASGMMILTIRRSDRKDSFPVSVKGKGRLKGGGLPKLAEIREWVQ